MRENIQIQYKESPVLLDKVLQDIQQALTSKLSWLDCAFGRAYKQEDYRESRGRFTYPAVYLGKGEYMSVLPNDNIGNFSWFDIYDPQDITADIQTRPQVTISGALVFWYDQSSIYEDDSFIRAEEIKDEVLRLLTSPGFIKTGSHLTIKRVYEKSENIYQGYSLEQVENKQFFTYPYAGLRIEFVLTTRELCQRYTK